MTALSTLSTTDRQNDLNILNQALYCPKHASQSYPL